MTSRLPPRRATLLFLLAFVLLLLPLCFLGYGSDNDTYGVLDAGRSTWLSHHLATSRHPGYWLFEAIVFVLSQVGGYVLTNLASLAIATAVLWRFILLARRFGARSPLLLATCLAATPVFLIAATSTIDYLWSLLFLVLLVEALGKDRPWRAMIFAAIAIAFRAANGVPVAACFAAVLLGELATHRTITARARRLAIAGLLSAVLGGAPLLLSAYLVHWTSTWTEAYMGPNAMWTLKMRAGRFVYKGLYLYGPIATVLLAAACLPLRRSATPTPTLTSRLSDPATRPFFLAALGLLLGDVYLFWKFPIEVSYAIPAALFFLLLTGTTVLANARAALVVIAVCIASLNVILFEFAQPNIPGMATGAHLHFSVTEGTLLQDIHDRLPVRGCTSNDCWNLQHGTLPGH